MRVLIFQIFLYKLILTEDDYTYSARGDVRVSPMGLVEMYHRTQSTWGGVCAKQLTDEVARVICGEVGLGTDGILKSNPDVKAQVSFWEEISCSHSAKNITDCDKREFTNISKCDDNQFSQLTIICGTLDPEVDCENSVIDQYYRTKCNLTDLQSGKEYEVIQCWNSSVIYTVRKIDLAGGEGCVFSNFCPNGTSNYQGCGCPGVRLADHVCSTLICRSASAPKDDNPIVALDSLYLCDGFFDCIGGEDEADCGAMFQCGIGGAVPQQQSGRLPEYYLCDGQSDCLDGEDEWNCNHGPGVGTNCTISSNKSNQKGGLSFVDKRQMCNNANDCDIDEDVAADEDNCEELRSTVMKCRDSGGDMIDVMGKEVCEFPNMTFVDGYCEAYIDQMNCSDTNAFVCPVRVGDDEVGLTEYPNTRVRRQWVCNNKELCADGSDEWCHVISDRCTVHKHQLCDGHADCEGAPDESKTICHNVSRKTCQRRYVRSEMEEMALPVTWLCDGQEDCLNGMDERSSEWRVCGSGEESVCYPNTPEYDCSQGFKCPDKQSTYVSLGQLCNYDESCGGAEGILCDITKSSSRTTPKSNYTIYIPPCLPGLMTPGNCSKLSLETRTTLVSPTVIHVSHTISEQGIQVPQKQKCDGLIGFEYVLFVCLGLCEDMSKKWCPLQRVSDTKCIGENLVHIPDMVHHKVQKVLSYDGRYQEAIFVCKNSNCLPKSKVCDLVDDCGDGSDEDGCGNNFPCQTGTPRYIRKDQVCDGTHDCNNANHTDECNEECSNSEIINSIFLKTCTFLIGSTSVLVNLYMVGVIIAEKKFFTSRVHFMNKSLVCLISLGDFCVGVYLLNVFVVDQVYRTSFCVDRYEWVTSQHCTALGLLSTFGTQLSIFSMLVLSIYRMVSLKSVGGRARVTTQHIVIMSSIAGSLIFLAAFVSLIPIVDNTEDYFTNGLYYKSNTLFNKVANLEVHKNFIRAYKTTYNSHKSEREYTTQTHYTWDEVRRFMSDHVFTPNLPDVQGKSLKFYGSDGVCLFKYFVSPDDPQRIFSLTILTLNLVCFGIISATYIYVVVAARGPSSAGKTTSRDQRNSRLHTKITLMVATNVVSWVPFGVICLLHTVDKIDATPFYNVSSVLLLPINSCVNPIIYSNIIMHLYQWITNKNSSWMLIFRTKLDQSIQTINQSRDNILNHSRDDIIRVNQINETKTQEEVT